MSMRLITLPSKSSCITTERDVLAREHLSLVAEILRQLSRRLPRHVDRDDLAGAGALALVEAALLFEPERGADFPAFARKRIRGAMLDELRRWDWAARSVRTECRRGDDVADSLRMQLGREPSERERAAAQGVSVGQLRRIESDVVRARVASLHEVAEAVGVDRLAADTATPADLLIEREETDRLHDAVESLPQRERHAVAGYYLQDRPMWELARELGVTPSRVSQLCRRGLSLLQQHFGGPEGVGVQPLQMAG
jgi:RNA polymerase sigma factor for flagellar operon FliA